MKINNLRSQGLEYLKQVKKTLRSKRQSQKELLLWDPTPRATSQVTQCWLCEHSRQACPSVKEMGLICNFLSSPQIFRWTCFLTYLKVRGKIREYKLTSIISLRDKKIRAHHLRWKNQFGCRQLPWTKDLKARGSLSVEFNRLWLMSQAGEQQLHHQNQTRTVHQDKSGEGKPHSWKPEAWSP